VKISDSNVIGFRQQGTPISVSRMGDTSMSCRYGEQTSPGIGKTVMRTFILFGALLLTLSGALTACSWQLKPASDQGADGTQPFPQIGGGSGGGGRS
jgi:hypothetical protein